MKSAKSRKAFDNQKVEVPLGQLRIIFKLTIAIHTIIQGVTDISKTIVGFVPR